MAALREDARRTQREHAWLSVLAAVIAVLAVGMFVGQVAYWIYLGVT